MLNQSSRRSCDANWLTISAGAMATENVKATWPPRAVRRIAVRNRGGVSSESIGRRYPKGLSYARPAGHAGGRGFKAGPALLLRTGGACSQVSASPKNARQVNGMHGQIRKAVAAIDKAFTLS